ncbi:insulinase family protein [Desulfurispira natronophila]|uniref:Peptidase M16C associated domain-containing protein n=1 Tax=Desulfurispira natronophila TaxID=682562 RepID=A0A7W7Y486_9BACT|nr:insulinase family protein [Desulfurispira natronophila]MBB5021790.1 hypothetical protein [Desulfurispira natronophila]
MADRAFTLQRTYPIDPLKITARQYLHQRTGAQHIHLQSPNDENAFMVAFRTAPQDSTGIAHILEHTVLCGSEKYPVRDPFFMMTRRSLNTFMNAFTGSDWTAYPFASKNVKDFYNLLDVYLDAVFFSRLDPLDFLQEGHRLEFSQPDDPSTALVRRGIVYNEMKGAMSSPVSVLWQTMSHYLYPTTTYHHNSGGDPTAIPQLTYEQLLEFYRSHYHPGNAIFLTFGNLPVEEIQDRLEKLALHRFSDSVVPVSVPDELRYREPLQVEAWYPYDDEEQADQPRTHIVVGWLLGKSTDLKELFQAELLSAILLDNSASPLRRALETTDLGSSPSPLCGVEESYREMCFVCGLEGSEADRADDVEALVLQVLQDISGKGVDIAVVESALHQLELDYREIGGDSLPFGLQAMLQVLPGAIHGGDSLAMLDIEPVLAELRKEIQQSDFIPSLVQRLFLDNPHRVRLVLKPDSKLSQKNQQQERQVLDQLQVSLDDRQKQQLVETAQKLARRQEEPQDLSILPKVGLEDVSPRLQMPEPLSDGLAGWPGAWYDQQTNGLCYFSAIKELPQLEQEQLPHFGLYAFLLPELGCGNEDYLTMQQRLSSATGGLGASTSVRGSVHDPRSFSGFFSLTSKALERNASTMARLVRDFHSDVRFDETQRIRELVAQKRAAREQSITGSGHILAMTAAASSISPVAALSHRSRGLAGIVSLKQLDRELDRADAMETFQRSLNGIHEQVCRAPLRLLAIGSEQLRLTLQPTLEALWAETPVRDPFFPMGGTIDAANVHQMWIASTQVHFCAKAYPTVAASHPDAAALTVLGPFLRNGYLHRVIREQGGAYGGGAGQDSGLGVFRFFSYRDPHLQETLDAFDQSLDWLQKSDHSAEKVEEAVLGVVASIDKPGSPAGEAQKAYVNALHGRSPDFLRMHRQRIMDVTLSDLQRVANTYLKPGAGRTAVLTHSGSVDLGESLGFAVHRV